MRFPVDEEIKMICSHILSRSLTPDEWAEIQPDDEFSTPHYEGGFEAIEIAFYFSRFIDEHEWWFQITIDEVAAIDRGDISEIEVRPAEL